MQNLARARAGAPRLAARWLTLCVAAGAAGLAGTACAAPAPDSKALYAAVLAEVGTATCTTDADCSAVAVGHKACGGPTGYLAWSVKVSDPARLTQKVAAHAAAEASAAATSGMASNCMMLANPGAECKAQRCVLKGP